jgi:hypothetical protein
MSNKSFTIAFFYLLQSLGSFAQETGNSCWKKTYNRGAGVFPNSCDANSEMSGFVCYPKCQAGYTGSGPVCWENCPNDFTVSITQI